MEKAAESIHALGFQTMDEHGVLMAIIPAEEVTKKTLANLKKAIKSSGYKASWGYRVGGSKGTSNAKDEES